MELTEQRKVVKRDKIYLKCDTERRLTGKTVSSFMNDVNLEDESAMITSVCNCNNVKEVINHFIWKMTKGFVFYYSSNNKSIGKK